MSLFELIVQEFLKPLNHRKCVIKKAQAKFCLTRGDVETSDH